MESNLHPYLESRINSAVGILNDSNLLLWARTHPDQPLSHNDKLPPLPQLGGGNWLIISGCFSVLLLLTVINWFYEERPTKRQLLLQKVFPKHSKKIFRYSDRKAFKKLIISLPSNLPSGLDKKSRTIDRALNKYRHPLAHTASVGPGGSGATLVDPVGYIAAIMILASQKDPEPFPIREDGKLISTAFYKKGHDLYCFSDLLNLEMYRIVEIIKSRAATFSEAQVKAVINHMRAYD